LAETGCQTIIFLICGGVKIARVGHKQTLSTFDIQLHILSILHSVHQNLMLAWLYFLLSFL